MNRFFGRGNTHPLIAVMLEIIIGTWDFVISMGFKVTLKKLPIPPKPERIIGKASGSQGSVTETLWNLMIGFEAISPDYA